MIHLEQSEVQALNAALADARARGRLREFPTLAALRDAVAPLFAEDARPAILDAPDAAAGEFFGVAIVTPRPGLEVGDWRAGPVTCDGRDGVVVVFVVEEAVVGAWGPGGRV